MKSSEKALQKVLSEITLRRPMIKLYSNFDSKVHSNPERIKLLLAKQLSSPVRWEQTLNEFYYNENLPKEQTEGKEDPNLSDEAKAKEMKKHGQFADRVYPDIYECGPGSHTGPILKSINHKAFQFYKHIKA